MSGPFDPYNNISYLDINKRRYPDYDRDDSERLENRYQQPIIKKLYLKRNGDESTKKPKLYIWRVRQTPGMDQLLDDLETFMAMPDGADALYDVHGHRINHVDEIKDRSTYYVTGSEPLMFDNSPRPRAETRSQKRQEVRRSSMSAPELQSFSRNSLYADMEPSTPSPRPHPVQLSKRKVKEAGEKRKEQNRKELGREKDVFERYYQAATKIQKSQADDYDYRNPEYYRTPEVVESRARTSYDHYPRETKFDDSERYRSRSAHDDYVDPRSTYSDFHDDGWLERDRTALERHKEKNSFRQRSNSGIIYNRRDQTNPEASLIYVFLNGQGMESQYVAFQKKQLEKGLNYVLELVARRFKVNPGKLCDMDGRKVQNVSDLISRGAYVLVPVGQTFRDTWYFLPDNAIDTSNRERIDDRSAQRDRLLQRREKRSTTKLKSKKPVVRSMERSESELLAKGHRYRYD